MSKDKKIWDKERFRADRKAVVENVFERMKTADPRPKAPNSSIKAMSKP